ncbi:MAG TPA: hypothetical protein ENN54_02820 [Thermoplasmatales archaeon]|nr:hypothetical protein [Thermoplasmatales archaeon]
MPTGLSLKGMAVMCLVTGMIAVSFLAMPEGEAEYTGELKTFSSRQELLDYIENQAGKGGYGRYYLTDGSVPTQMETLGGAAAEYHDDFSATNIQVEGVDEPDMVKTDGGYLYIIAQGKIWIVQAYPPENASLVAHLAFSESQQPRNLLVQGDVLVVLGTAYRNHSSYWWTDTTLIQVFNISDRSTPVLTREITVDGWYLNARLIGSHLYVISSDYLGRVILDAEKNQSVCLPQVTVDNCTQEIDPSSIYYPDDGEGAGSLVHVTAVSLATGNPTDSKSFLMESAQDMYVSRQHIFLINAHYDGESGRGEGTSVHKIAVSNGTIAYRAHGEVPGRVLNQFSMDEYRGFFRIATTTWSSWWSNSSNNLYILDDQLQMVSKIEHIAPGESIYAARFMGDRAYLVTFKKIDPFFTIDLADPYAPQILGELKITGYSDYLHPLGENHVLGIGKESVEASSEDKQNWGQEFAWYQGLKIALFDITNFSQPREVAKIVIGDRGTDSPALHDHHALLFDWEKDLLVLPVSVYQIDKDIKQQTNYTGSLYGSFVYQGAYVLHVNTEEMEVRGRITHQDNTINVSAEPFWYRWEGTDHVVRSLYINTTLYTVSESTVKMHALSDLTETGIVFLSPPA